MRDCFRFFRGCDLLYLRGTSQLPSARARECKRTRSRTARVRCAQDMRVFRKQTATSVAHDSGRSESEAEASCCVRTSAWASTWQLTAAAARRPALSLARIPSWEQRLQAAATSRGWARQVSAKLCSQPCVGRVPPRKSIPRRFRARVPAYREPDGPRSVKPSSACCAACWGRLAVVSDLETTLQAAFG